MLQTAAFPPLALFPLAWIALVPLLCALVRSVALEGFVLGLLWSLLVGLGTSSWLPGMIADYFEVSVAWGWTSAALATAGTGLFYGVFGAWLAALARRSPPSVLATALLWGACEYGRLVAPVANPWMLSGYTQVPFAPLRQLADVGGVIAIGMLLAAANATLAGLVDRRWRPRRPRPTRLATAAVLLAVLAYGSWRLVLPFDEGEDIDVALVQSAIDRERRFQPRFRRENLAHQLDLVARAGRDRPDLILLSELAFDVPLDRRSGETRSLGRIAEDSGADILVGAPLVTDLLVWRQQRNSFFLLRGQALADRYDKVDLAPFSETNPLRPYLQVGRDHYAPGTSRRPLTTRAGAVGVLLCSEGMFGSYARETVRRGAEILANPANDSWFGSEGAARAQLDIARLRAVETRRWLLRPTFSGVTAVVDPHGRVVAEAGAGRPAILRGRVRRSQAETFHLRYGEVVAQAGSAGAVAWSLFAGFSRRRRVAGARGGARDGSDRDHAESSGSE